MVPRIGMAAVRKSIKPKAARNRTQAPPPESPLQEDKGTCTVVGIGASAGGLEALSELLQSLPRDPGFALVLIQHLDPKHSSILSELLGRASAIPVSQARDALTVEPDHIYVIPPNSDMTLSDGKLHLRPRAASGHHMPVDTFFRSLADDQASKAIGVVLSGTASDGTMGLKAIKAQGGITFAQDSRSAKYDGMPRSAIAAGCVDFVLPPNEIAGELVRLCRHPYLNPAPETSEKGGDEDKPAFSEIFALLRQATGVDFNFYKSGTIRRRTLRRMALHKMDNVRQYARHLRDNHAELQALFQDILINVTAFFREPDTFARIRSMALPALFKDRSREDPLRVWVPGCSTGEEVYSIAICILEYMRSAGVEIPLQIFGTDLSESALDKARAGVYPDSIAVDVSAERLGRFFVRVDSSYKIARSIRDSCVFARQNVTKDPPFSRLDLILCRNLLIYLGPVLQLNVMRIFHYALRPTGYLVLGQSESITGAEDLFVAEERKLKIFSKRQATETQTPDYKAYEEPHARVESNEPPPGGPAELSRQVDYLLVTQYSPPAIVINADMQIVHFRGQTAPYLEHASGEANLNLLKMAPAILVLEIRKLIQKADLRNGKVKSGLIRISRKNGDLNAIITAIPFASPAFSKPHYLVIFEDASDETPPLSSPKGKGSARNLASGLRNRELEQELISTRKYLQAIIEEQEAAAEELKSAHEELQSGNEELQSTNEELLTAKEELQSTNEELTTVNEEMQSRNSELRQLNNDLLNLLTSVNIPIMMLGNDLRIRRFTPHAEKILNLLATDIGRPISDFRLKINVPDLARLCQDVLDDLTARDREVQDAEGRTYSMWIRPYRTAENRIDGVVLALLDITGRKQPAEVRYRRIFETAADGFVVVDAASGEVLDVNPQVVRMFGHARSALVGTRFWEGPLFGGGVMESSVLEELKHSGSLERLRTLRAESGELIQTEIVCTRYLEGVRQVALFTIRNPGARKQTEALVRRQESEVGQTRKLEAVTKLAGGVAHDFGNLLTTILGYCDLLSEQLAALDGPPRELLAQIRAAAENAARLTRQLLAFGRRHIGPPEIVDLNEVVRGMQQILAISVPGKIRVETDLSPEAGCVVFDRGQLEQVILHLALNAAEAAPDGGRITVKTEAVDVDQDFSRRHPSVPEGQYYVLSVQDSGGALETEREQAFETMYSTMTQGRSPAGSGAVYEIVKRSGGHLWVYSELGVGSTCSIYMPRAQAGSAQPSRIEPVGGSETILLVEDDPALRTMTRLVLGRLGYRVLEAAGGPEALSMARDEGPIHLLITDALLPAMSGRDIASELAPARPEMKVLYISGYPETAFADQGILGDGRAFLPKPFSQSALASKIREALDGNPSG